MDFFDYIKNSQIVTNQKKKQKCKSKQQKMNQTFLNTFTERSSPKNNNITGRLESYPNLPHLNQKYNYY